MHSIHNKIYRAMLIEIDKEDDGRRLAEVADLPGVMSYGATREEAAARAKALALRVIADRLEHGEDDPVTLWRTMVW